MAIGCGRVWVFRISFKVDVRCPLLAYPILLNNDRVKCQQEVKVHRGENKKVYVQGQPFVFGFPKLSELVPNGGSETNNTGLVLLFKITRTLFGWVLLCKSPESMGLGYSQIQDSGMPVSPLRLVPLLRYGRTGDIGTKSVIGPCWVFLVDRLGRQKISPFFASLITFIVLPVHETLNSASTMSNRLLDYIVLLWLQRMTAVETLGI
jgi:hypothetical protein